MDEEREIVVIWDCSCPKEIGEIPSVETKCTSVQIEYDEEGKEWVVITGFIERCSRCKKRLGDGYGDVNMFPSEEEAKSFANSFKLGEWKNV